MVRLFSSITATLLFAVAPLQVFAHSYGPAPRVTGAPGDNPKACTQCHTTNALNSGTGSVKVTAQSGSFYIPGVKQRITVQVADPTQVRWGFELSARLNSDLANGQAGDLNPIDNQTQVICEDAAPKPCATGIQFIQHTSVGTRNGTKNGAAFQFDWTPPASNLGPVTLYVAGNAANGNGANTGDQIYTSSLQLNPAVAAAPVVAAGNIISAVSSTAGPVAANSWVSIYGTNLSPTTRAWTADDFNNGGLPYSLDGVSVLLTGAPRLAYIGYVSPTQINFLIPTDQAPATLQVQVKNSAGISAQVPITVTATAGQLYTLDGKYVLGTHGDGSLIGKAGTPNNASTGENIIVYATGCGQTTPALITGVVPTQTAPLAAPPTVTIGGIPATVTSAGILPNSAGVYQIAVQVPANAPTGDQPVVMQLGGVNTGSALLTISK